VAPDGLYRDGPSVLHRKLGNRQYEWRDRCHAAPSQTTFQNEIGWFGIRQKAINDAIAATPTSDVMVYHYVELNAVQTAMAGSARVINSVVPYLNSMADFVSYSSYDSLYPNESWS